jgi:hypothetical protein
MNTQQISYRELATLPRHGHKIAAFHAILSVIPDLGCRLFVHWGQVPLAVVDDDGHPMYFPSVEAALKELAILPGADHQVTVDIISLIPRAIPRNRFSDGIGKVLSRLLGQSRPASHSLETT